MRLSTAATKTMNFKYTHPVYKNGRLAVWYILQSFIHYMLGVHKTNTQVVYTKNDKKANITT